MIYVGGVPFSPDSSKGNDILVALMEHPILVSASSSFREIPERKVSLSAENGFKRTRQSKCVYIFQREYATVDPALVDLVGTDEATTCVGLVLRNRKSGMTSVSHMDFANVVDIGLTQMLSLVVDHDADTELDVHLIGAYNDALPQHADIRTISESHLKLNGHSFPLCMKIVEILQRRREIFYIQTLHVLGHNTRWNSEGNAVPVFHGFLVETSTGSIMPASFDRTSRCPDEIVRRVRVMASFEDRRWKGRLLDTYDTHTDQFVIAPCSWTMRLSQDALALQNLSDSEILLNCSTSPAAEGPDFVDSERRILDHLIQHPDWRDTFPMKQPRIFVRSANGGWTKL